MEKRQDTIRQIDILISLHLCDSRDLGALTVKLLALLRSSIFNEVHAWEGEETPLSCEHKLSLSGHWRHKPNAYILVLFAQHGHFDY